MKNDTGSKEAERPPEKPPCRESGTGVSDENKELAWAQKQVSREWSGPGVVCRKIVLHDQPPGSFGFRPAAVIRKRRDRIREKITARPDAPGNRPGDRGHRIDLAIGQPGRRTHTLETREVS